jgi:Leucine-rich repeat (LRR) protein
MDSNQIKSISPELGSLTLLKHLSIAHNALEVIPVSIHVTTIVVHFFGREFRRCLR